MHPYLLLSRKLNLKNFDDWRTYISGDLPELIQKPKNIPNSPQFVYKDIGWKSWGDFLHGETLAYKRRVIDALEYEQAKKFVSQLNLKTWLEWKSYCRGKFQDLPPISYNIPKQPNSYYKNKGWVSMNDWLDIN